MVVLQWLDPHQQLITWSLACVQATAAQLLGLSAIPLMLLLLQLLMADGPLQLLALILLLGGGGGDGAPRSPGATVTSPASSSTTRRTSSSRDRPATWYVYRTYHVQASCVLGAVYMPGVGKGVEDQACRQTLRKHR